MDNNFSTKRILKFADFLYTVTSTIDVQPYHFMTDIIPAPIPEIVQVISTPELVPETVPDVKRSKGRPIGSLGKKKKSIIKQLIETNNKKRGRPHGSKNKQKHTLTQVLQIELVV